MAKIVVVGSLNMDVVAVAPRIPVAGETLIGSKFFTSPGGKGANQAYAAAKLGGSVAMLGRVGDDDFGRQMRQNLASVKETTGDLFALRWGRVFRPSPESKLPEGEQERRLNSLVGTAGEGEKARE